MNRPLHEPAISIMPVQSGTINMFNAMIATYWTDKAKFYFNDLLVQNATKVNMEWFTENSFALNFRDKESRFIIQPIVLLGDTLIISVSPSGDYYKFSIKQVKSH